MPVYLSSSFHPKQSKSHFTTHPHLLSPPLFDKSMNNTIVTLPAQKSDFCFRIYFTDSHMWTTERKVRNIWPNDMILNILILNITTPWINIKSLSHNQEAKCKTTKNSANLTWTKLCKKYIHFLSIAWDMFLTVLKQTMLSLDIKCKVILVSHQAKWSCIQILDIFLQSIGHATLKSIYSCRLECISTLSLQFIHFQNFF